MVHRPLLLILLLGGVAWSDTGYGSTIRVTESDNSPACTVGQIKFSPGTVTCNGQSVTVTNTGGGGGGGTGGSITQSTQFNVGYYTGVDTTTIGGDTDFTFNGTSVTATGATIRSLTSSTGTISVANISSMTTSGQATFSALTASLPVQTSATSALVSAAIDLSGSQATGIMASGREPAHTGDVTNSAGSLAMTAAATQANIKMFTSSITVTNTAGMSVAGPISGSSMTLSLLSASLPVQTDSNKALTSAAINVSGSQITGTLAATNFPALTGDITTSAGNLATTAATVQGNIKTFTAPITVTSSLTVAQGIQTSTFSVTSASASFNNVPYVWPANTMVGATPLSFTVDSSSRIALSGSSGSGYSTVQDEGSGLTQRATLNFIGSNIACVDNAGSSRTDCTLSAAGAGDAVLASTQQWSGGNNYAGYSNFTGSITASGLVGASSITVTDQLLVPSKAGFTTSTNASIGFDSTRVTYLAGVPSFASSIPLISSFAIVNQSLTNSTASDQDFVTISTIPANRLISGKCFRVTLHFQTTAGVSAVTASLYLKLGSTKLYIQPVSNWTDSLTRSNVAELFITGTAAAGASVSVQGNQSASVSSLGNGANNSVSQPVAGIATNGALGITPGITYSGTGSTEIANLMFYTVQEMN